MKVFIVAKMRATLQKQHKDTAVTQPDAQLHFDLSHCVLTTNAEEPLIRSV